MRTFEEILKEVLEQAAKDNCQSWNVICLLAMEQAARERKQEIIEQLEELSNNYEVMDNYVILKTTLDNYIEGLWYRSF
jgi:hypothetical protein